MLLLQTTELINAAKDVNPGNANAAYGFIVVLLLIYSIFSTRQIFIDRKEYRDDLKLRDEELKNSNKDYLKILTEVAILIKGDERSRQITTRLLTLMQEGFIKVSKSNE